MGLVDISLDWGSGHKLRLESFSQLKRSTMSYKYENGLLKAVANPEACI